MTFDELMRAILAILPNAQLGEDNDGQIVVYTNKKQDSGGVVHEMVELTIDEALDVLGRAIQTDDNKAHDALDAIRKAFENA